jgi:hypothetical protein
VLPSRFQPVDGESGRTGVRPHQRPPFRFVSLSLPVRLPLPLGEGWGEGALGPASSDVSIARTIRVRGTSLCPPFHDGSDKSPQTDSNRGRGILPRFLERKLKSDNRLIAQKTTQNQRFRQAVSPPLKGVGAKRRGMSRLGPTFVAPIICDSLH